MIWLSTWVNCTELRCIPGCSLFQSYMTSNKSNSSNLCTVDTSCGCTPRQLKTATRACVTKKDVDIHAAEPLGKRGICLLLWQQLSSVIQTPVNDSFHLFTLLWGRDSMYLQMGCWSWHCTILSGDILPPLHKYYQIINTERPLNTWKYNNTSSGTQAVLLKWQETKLLIKTKTVL